jgi:putative ABC transport system substrate-binding protein
MAEAQQPKKIPRIGFLGSGSSSTQKFLANNFRQGLRELGYIEGHNIAIEYRYADRKEERFADFAAEMVLRA